MRPKFLFPLALAVVILSGCAAVGPDYVKPQTPVSAAWNNRLKGDAASGKPERQPLAAWWAVFKDSELTGLVEQAVAGSLDLRKARAKLREARAKRGAAQTELYPALDASGSAARSRTSGDTGTGTTGALYTAGLDASWELDIFGGVRRSVEAAEADLQASQEDLRDVLVSLLAEVALNYADLRTYQTRLDAAEANLKSQDETCRLTLWRFQAGLSDELAAQQARYNLENTRSKIPTLRAGVEEAKNRLAVLLGKQPGALHGMLKDHKPIPAVPLKVAVGIPANVLRQRPDVRRAERQLAAQTARVGTATAELYPKFKLSGSIGLEALTLGSLFSSGSGTMSGGSSFSWRIFDAGAVRRNIETQSALQEQYLVAYEAAVLGALKEVEKALTAYAEEQHRRDALSEATRAAKEAAELARYKYEAGLSDFSSVLEAERSLLTFQDELAQSEGTIVSDLINLYKALGGGWESLVPEEKKPPAKEKRA